MYCLIATTTYCSIGIMMYCSIGTAMYCSTGTIMYCVCSGRVGELNVPGADGYFNPT